MKEKLIESEQAAELFESSIVQARKAAMDAGNEAAVILLEDMLCSMRQAINVLARLAQTATE